jgi:peroxiredoxin
VTWIVVGVVAAAVLYALFTGSSTSPPVGRGSAAPDFALPSLDSERPIALSSLRGQVVLVNFWATWCKPCEDEMPAMDRLYRELHPAGFELLAISVGEQPSVVREFRDRLGVTFPVLLDSDKSVATRWQTFAFPESLLVDRDGTVLERYVGPRDWDAPAYVARIRRLLDEQPRQP